MLKEERQRQILIYLQTHGRVLAADLSQQLGVSVDTIRRDLRQLSDSGKMQRVHGGALPRSPVAGTYQERTQQWPETKAAIARAALQLIHDEQVILLDGGTTTLQVAQHLPMQLHATLVTNSPLIAAALAVYPHAEVILIGGRLYKESRVTTGAAAVQTVRQLRADLCLLGICSLDPEVGISVLDYEEASIKQAMISSSAQVAALASPEKLNTASPYIVAPLSALTHLVTDGAAPAEVLAPYRAAGVQIVQT